jgi:hypothetical protein
MEPELDALHQQSDTKYHQINAKFQKRDTKYRKLDALRQA